MAQASMPLQYKRLYKGPLNVDDVFDTLEAAEEYAASATGYGGHVIGVLVDGKRVAFIVNDDGTLTRQATAVDVQNAQSVWDEL